MNDVAQIRRLCKKVEASLRECQSAQDHEVKVASFAQAHVSLEEIILGIDSHFADLDTVFKFFHMYFRVLNADIPLFFSGPASAARAGSLVLMFMECSFRSEVSRDLSAFITEFLFRDVPNATQCFSAVGRFFGTGQFNQSFEETGGLFALWSIICDPLKSAICQLVFSAIENRHLQKYCFRDPSDLLQRVTASFCEVHPPHLKYAVRFLARILRDSDSIAQAFDLKILKAVGIYAIERDLADGFEIYNLLSQFWTARPHDFVTNLSELIERKTISQSMRNAGLQQFVRITKSIDPSCIKTSYLYSIFYAIEPNDFASIETTFGLCKFLAGLPQFNAVSLVPAVFRLVSLQFALDCDLQPFVDILTQMGAEASPFIPIMFGNFTRGSSKEVFAAVLRRYPALVPLACYCFTNQTVDKDLVRIFVEVGPLLPRNSGYRSVLQSVVENFEALPYALEHLTKGLAKALIVACENSRPLRAFLLRTDWPPKLRHDRIPRALLFDLLVSMTGRLFDPAFDRQVCSWLKSVRFLGATSKAISKLAFGCYRSNRTKKVLCFPSLLYKINHWTVKSPFELWICGQYGVETWLKESGKPIDQLPGIDQIARRFILPKHFRIILHCPDLLVQCLESEIESIPLFEFSPFHSDQRINIPLSGNSSDASVTFWVRFPFTPKSDQIICRIGSLQFVVRPDNTVFCGYIMVAPLVTGTWYLITFAVTGRHSVQMYLDLKLVFSESSQVIDVVELGGLDNQNAWFIGGAIRVFAGILELSHIQTIYECNMGSCHLQCWAVLRRLHQEIRHF